MLHLVDKETIASRLPSNSGWNPVDAHFTWPE